MDNGVVKKVDELGRIVIPKDIRKNLKINNGDVLKIFVDGQKIQLMKHSEISYNVNSIKFIFDAFIETFSDYIIFTDREKVLLSNIGFDCCDIPSEISEYIEERVFINTNEQCTYIFGSKNVEGYFCIVPVISSISSIGSIILVSKSYINSDKKELLKFISLLIAKVVDISC